MSLDLGGSQHSLAHVQKNIRIISNSILVFATAVVMCFYTAFPAFSQGSPDIVWEAPTTYCPKTRTRVIRFKSGLAFRCDWPCPKTACFKMTLSEVSPSDSLTLSARLLCWLHESP